VPATRQDYLTRWLEIYEDSLFIEFTNYVKENSLCSTCDTSWGEMAYERIDTLSYMGKFSKEVKKYSDSLEVTFFYNRQIPQPCRILISTGYNSSLCAGLDSLLMGSFKPRHFVINKYVQPIGTNLYYILDGTPVLADSLVLYFKKVDTVYDVDVFIRSSQLSGTIPEPEREGFTRILFGEELLLKKIRYVEILYKDTSARDFITYSEFYKKMR